LVHDLLAFSELLLEHQLGTVSASGVICHTGARPAPPLLWSPIGLTVAGVFVYNPIVPLKAT
jgi:hypothetical protein